MLQLARQLQPVEVDPRRFCKDTQSWEVQSNVAAFPRLALEFTHGELFCRVAGRADQLGSLSLKVTVQGRVEMTCQRCLGAMQHAIEIDRAVYLARTGLELERLDDMPDSDAILVDERLDLVGLVEDEVLLDLPLAAMHEAGQCPARGAQ
ncbi:MAG: YceD family protein [Gammaproteobacteria bacterium]